jgi:NAD(P)-dependent dehydrogenase (short-subunit alcohol dehydrogenase family)
MNKDIFDLSGKTAIVSGASRGIGEATAKLLAAYGAQVICSSRKLDGSGAVAEAIQKNGGKAVAMACHVGETQAIDAFVAGIEKQFGRVDILVNNAAANPYFGHILDTPLDAMQKTIEVNIRGFFYMSQRIGQLMKQQGGGSIVNTASINGVRPGMGQGIYSITKAAIINMTQAFAKECAPHKIRCNAVLPGLTDTKFASALTRNEQILKAFLPAIPMNRVAQPDEIAPAILFLASDASSYVTGSCITADGGYLS